MRKVKYIITLALSAVVMALPLSASSAVFADENNWQNNGLQCTYLNGEGTTTNNCDLSVDKMVSVNGSTPVDAPTSASAVQAHVGDSVVWTVTVTNTSTDHHTPQGTVTVKDVVPAGLTNVSGVPTSGTYTNNIWTFSVADLVSDGSLTLTINSTASTLGLIENTAAFACYIPCPSNNDSNFSVDSIVNSQNNESCDPAYSDSNSDNNSSSAFVNVVATPVVAAPVIPAVTPAATVAVAKAPNTGFGVLNASPVSTVLGFGLIASTFFGFSYVTRRFNKQ